MKISILSDFHFGHGWNTELEEDSFQNAQEAIEKAVNSDVILIAGDLFNSRTPSTEVWAKALRVLSKPLLCNPTGVMITDTIKKTLEDISRRTLLGIPIIAIHGTHERRGKGQINAIEALEQAGFLVYLHCNGLVLEKDDERVAIQGMSGVPERYAKQVLDKWNPQPIEGCYNILMLHQSIEPYVYSPLEPPSLNLSNLPKGFDLIIDGHIHTHGLRDIDGTTLLMPGSTIVTQLKEEESRTPKGFYQLDVSERKFTFVELKRIRRFFFREIVLDEDKTIGELVDEEMDSILTKTFEKKPLVRIRIVGKKSTMIDRELKEKEKEYRERAILSFLKRVETPEVMEKLEILKKMREERISLEEMGMRLLHENLKNMKFKGEFNPTDIFRLLSEGEVERAFNILTQEQKTLRYFGDTV